MSSSPETTADESPAAVAGGSQPQDPPTAAADAAENLSEKLDKMNISSSSFSIWPPTQRTRDAVINRLIETLSTPSVLSNRYGSMSHDEASTTARAIEEEAYSTAAATAGGGYASSSVDEGLEILQVYSKDISKRMLEAVKSRSATAADTTTTATATVETNAGEVSPVPESEVAGGVAAEEVSSVGEESSN